MIKTVLQMGAVVAVLASLAGAARADDVRLTFGDLDLSRPDQARVLDARIKRAAHTHCIGEIQTGTRLHHGCETTTRDAIMDALPATVRAAYLAGMKQPTPNLIASR